MMLIKLFRRRARHLASKSFRDKHQDSCHRKPPILFYFQKGLLWSCSCYLDLQPVIEVLSLLTSANWVSKKCGSLRNHLRIQQSHTYHRDVLYLNRVNNSSNSYHLRLNALNGVRRGIQKCSLFLNCIDKNVLFQLQNFITRITRSDILLF